MKIFNALDKLEWSVHGVRSKQSHPLLYFESNIVKTNDQENSMTIYIMASFQRKTLRFKKTLMIHNCLLKSSQYAT